MDYNKLREELGLKPRETTSPYIKPKSETTARLEKTIDERRKREEEEKRRKQERDAKIKAINSYSNPSPFAPTVESDSDIKMASKVYDRSPFSSSQIDIPSGQGRNKDIRKDYLKTQREKTYGPYKDFSNQLDNDFKDLMRMSKAVGKPLKKEDIIPPMDADIDKRLEKIASKIKTGSEGLLYSFKEGMYEKEIMNMLSKEYVRKMNGLPNNVAKIEKFLHENPELQSSDGRWDYARKDRPKWVDDLMRPWENIVINTMSPSMKDKYQDFFNEAREDFPEDINIVKDPKFWRKSTRGVGDQAAQRLDSLETVAPYTATYTTLGATMGVAFSTPTLGTTAPITATSGALLGFKYGMTVGSAKHSAMLEAGSAYRELLEEGIPHEIAKPIAKGVGAVNGIIEVANILPEIENVIGLDAIIETAKREGVKATAKHLKKLGINYVAEVGGETLEEFLQENVNMLGTEIAKVYQSEQDPTVYGGFKNYAAKVGTPEWRNIMKDVTLETLNSMWLMPIVSGAGGAIVGQTTRSILDANQNKKKDHALYTVIPDMIKYADEDLLNDDESIQQFTSMKVSLQEGLNNPEVTNKDKQQIEALINDIDNKVGEMEYKAKGIDPTLEFLPANEIDIEKRLLNEDINSMELYNQSINEYIIETYKNAIKYGILENIKKGILNKENKSSIADSILKKLPRKERTMMSAMVYVNAVDDIMSEIKAQSIMNNFYNINIAKETIKGNPNEEIAQATIDTLEDSEEVVDINTQEEAKGNEKKPIGATDNTQSEEVNNEPQINERETNDELKNAENENSIEYKPSEVVMVPVIEIHFDPERFQFRYDQGNESGVTRKLEGAEYNPRLAGTVLLWQDEYGDTYVVNGHHRVDLAKNSNVAEIQAEIITHNKYTAEEARALGAMINIAEDNATAIDVAKVLRDSNITEQDLYKQGVRPKSKIARDGAALANLNDWIFTQVAVKKIPLERAVIIGRELGDNKDGQNQFIKAISQIEAKGKSITNDVMVEMLAEVKGTAQETFTEQTLFGEETFSKNYSVERAELVSYVKGQLKERVSVLKNVSKDKNASLLQELGNKIAIDDNVKEMNTADQALWIIDKTLNYQGTKTNEMFNNLAKEYAAADPKDKMKIKKQALNELIKLMEGGNLLNETYTTDSKRKRESAKRILQETKEDGAGQQEFGLGDIQSEGGQEVSLDQVNMFGEDAINQLKDISNVEIINADKVKNTKVYKETIEIAKAMQKNPFLNGLTIEYSNEPSRKYWTREELDNAGYRHFQEGWKETNGLYSLESEQRGRVLLNNEGDRTTIVEEAIHHIQSRAEEISPEFAVLLKDWEDEINAKAKALGINIPTGKELFAQAYVFGELGHADKGMLVSEFIAIDNDLVEMIETILGPEILDLARGNVESRISKESRVLKSEYKGFADRYLMKDGFANTIKKAKEKRAAEMRNGLNNNSPGIYYSPDSTTYAIVTPKDTKTQVSYFNEHGSIMSETFDNVDSAVDKLMKNKMYYKHGEIHYQLKQFTREVVDSIYQQLYENIDIKLSNNEIAQISVDARIGNFTANDYDNLILNNKNIPGITKAHLVEMILQAVDKGLDVPNSEVNFRQYLNRFYDIPLQRGITEKQFYSKHFIVRYNPENGKIELGLQHFNAGEYDPVKSGGAINLHDGERKFYHYETFDSLEDAIEDYKANVFLFDEEDIDKALSEAVKKKFIYTVDMLKDARGITKAAAERKVFNDLKDDYQNFKENIETYRHKGLNYNFDLTVHYNISYQLKDDAKIDDAEFKNWFRDSKVLDENERPSSGKGVYFSDGVFYEYDPSINYQLKSETPIVNVEGFYSNLENVINERMGKRGKAQDILNMLKKNGIKKDEMEWFEIESYLSDKDMVTKEELLDHMRTKAIDISKKDMGNTFQQYTLDGGEGYRFNAYVYKHDEKPFYSEAHFGPLANVIGHNRYKEFETIDGKGVLLVEELQSDWHQKGRQEGYLGSNQSQIDEIVNRYGSVEELLNTVKSALKDDDYLGFDYISDAMIAIRTDPITNWDLSDPSHYGIYEDYKEYSSLVRTDLVPDAPLKESITDFLFKQVVKDAVEGGYDYIAWTTGTQHADRWNVGNWVSKIGWRKFGEDKYNLNIIDKEGNLIYNETGISLSTIGEVAGNDISKQIAASTDNWGDIEDENLHIGGDFYKKLYDNYLPRMIRKYGKKWGINISEIALGSNYAQYRDEEYLRTLDEFKLLDISSELNLENASMEYLSTPQYALDKGREKLIQAILDKANTTLIQPSIPVTPQMIEDVMTQGQPLFQLKDIEGTNGNLVAMHNITEANLKNVLKLGGFPVPSIAIVKTDGDHSNFGEISLIFNKDTVDPKANKANKIYSGDAYTPTFPSIAYKINDKVARGIEGRITSVLNKMNLERFGYSYDPHNMSDQVNRWGGFSEAYYRSADLKLVYLDEHNIPFSPVMREKKYDWDYGVLEQLDDKFKGMEDIKYIGLEEAKSIETDIRAIINAYYQEALGRELYDDPLGFNKVSDIMRTLHEYRESGRALEVDTNATVELLNEMVPEQEFKDWLNNISHGLIEKEGYRNEKNMYTPSGNMRSWESLHNEVTLDNIVKYMKKQEAVANGTFGYTGRLIAAVSDKLSSIKQVKERSDMLQNINEEEYQAMRTAIGDKLLDLSSRIKDSNARNQYQALDTATEAIIEALGNGRTEAKVSSILNEYRGINYTDQDLKDIVALGDEAAALPRKYFEAKPYRAVGINEIQAAIVPNDTSAALIESLKKKGVKLIEVYGDEVTRQQAVDNILRKEDVSFQLKDSWDTDDVNEYYQMKEDPDTKERSWGQTVRDAELTTPWLKELLTSNKFMYEVKHNEDTLMAAAKLLDDKGEEYVEARLLSDLDNDAVLFAASQILTYKYMEEGQRDRALKMIEKSAEKATSLGQAIQILSVWGRQTPEGMLRYAAKEFSNAMTDEQKQMIMNKTKALVEEFNSINRRAIHNIDLVDTIKAVKDMPTDERAARDFATKGIDLPDGGFSEDLLKPFQNTIDEDMTKKITDVVNKHYLENEKGDLKNKLEKLGLNDFEVEILDKYIKSQIKEATRSDKQALIDKNLSKKSYERKGLDEQIIEMTTEGTVDENLLKNLVGEKEGMPVLNKELIDYIYEEGQRINSMEPGRERDVATAKMIQEISSHLPVSFWTKVKTFQTIAQLLNFKTTVRNLLGNDMFRRLDTFTLNFLGTPIDVLLSKFGGHNRTTLFRPIKANKAQKLGYKEGWRLGLEDALLGVDTSDENSKFELRRTKVFKSGVLGKAETALNIALRATDRAAFTATFMDSLEEQMLLSGVDTPTDEMTEKATMIALYRTFNDETALSKMFSGIKRNLNIIGSKDSEFGLGELILKYPKTPANILGRAIDYSPIGLLTTMLKLYRDTSGDTYFKQRTLVEGISRAVMGTGLITIGALLAQMGVLTGSNPDDDEDIYKLQKQYGLRDFSVNTSAIGRYILSGFDDPTAGELRKGDIVASYDWVEPIAMGLAIGSDTVLGGGEVLDLLSTVVRATETGATTLTEQPLLTGLANLFRHGNLVEGLTEVVKSMPSSFTPSLMAHVAQFIDGRDTDPYTFYGKGRQAWNLVQNRTPGLRGNIPSRYSVLGDERRYYPEDNNLLVRGLNIFLNPSITNKYMPNEEAELIFDLYNATNDPDIVPRPPQKSYKIDKINYTFTPESWAEMSEWLGKEYKSRISYAMETYMRGWSEEEQAEEIKWIIKDVKEEAKEMVRKIGKVVE